MTKTYEMEDKIDKRIPYLDCARTVAIFLVFLSHVVEQVYDFSKEAFISNRF